MAKVNCKASLLSESEIKLIYEASLKILETVGMKIDDERFLKALEAKGAIVDYKEHIVKFPPALIKETTRMVKNDFSEAQSARKPVPEKKKCEWGKVKGSWGGGPAVYYLDYEKQEIRRGTAEDALAIIRFADACDEISGISSTMLVYSRDLDGKEFPSRLWTLKSVALTAKNTSEITYAENIHSRREMEFILEIGKVLYGSVEEAMKRSICGSAKCVISPLKLEKNACDILYYCVSNGFPASVATMPISGATAPVTLAGTIALANAEILGGWTAIKAVNPKVKCNLVPWLSIMDMKSGSIVYGAPEALLENVGLAEVCRYFYGAGGIDSLYTDGKLPGEQAMMERCAYGFIGMAFGMGGGGAGGWLHRSQIISLEQFMVDSELGKWRLRFEEGFEVNEETLALDVIQRVGIGGNFLADEHTVQNYRQEFWMPEIFARGAVQDVSFKTYLESDVMKTANRKVKDIMKDYQPFQLDKAKAEEIDRIVAEAEKELVKE